jgi:metal-sulfur cluster biosynthetic enzyme
MAELKTPRRRLPVVEPKRGEGPEAGNITAREATPLPKAPRLEDALPRHVTSHASGGRDQWSPPMAEVPEDPEAATWALLTEVLDPELPISLVDLGLIYGVRVTEGRAVVDLTFTATACPCMEFIREDVEDRLLQERWIHEVEIREVWDPPWTRSRISERGRRQLRSLGVGA